MSPPKTGGWENLYGELGCPDPDLISSWYKNPRPSELVLCGSTPSTRPAFRGIPRASGCGAGSQVPRGAPRARLAAAGDGVRRRGSERAPWASPFASAHPTVVRPRKVGGLQSVGKVSKFPPGQGNFISISFYSLPSASCRPTLPSTGLRAGNALDLGFVLLPAFSVIREELS